MHEDSIEIHWKARILIAGQQKIWGIWSIFMQLIGQKKIKFWMKDMNHSPLFSLALIIL